MSNWLDRFRRLVWTSRREPTGNMAEREVFTDRGMKIMLLANQEAQHFNQERIGTEHMLLGLLREGSGVAANTMKNLGVDLRAIRLKVEQVAETGPVVTQGKLPMSPEAKQAIGYSIEEAGTLNHDYVGSEHILLGLLREQDGVAARVLDSFGITVAGVRAEIRSLLGP